MLAHETVGKAELAEALGHKIASGKLHKKIRRMLDLGLIAMTLSDKPSSRLRQYRLTEQGPDLHQTQRAR